MIELWSWDFERISSPYEETDELQPSLSCKIACNDHVPVHKRSYVGRHGFASPYEMRKARSSPKRRSRRQSPKVKEGQRNKYRMYNSSSRDYEDDRERAVSFTLEPTIIAPADKGNPSSQRDKLQVMIQSDDGDVISLEIDGFSFKELSSSLRSNNSTSNGTATTTIDVAERSGALNDVWVDPLADDSQEEADSSSDDEEVDRAICLTNRRRDGYTKCRPYVRKLSASEQKVLHRIRPDFSSAYPKMFESIRKEPADITVTITNSIETQGSYAAPIMQMRMRSALHP